VQRVLQNFRLFHERRNAQQQFIRFQEETKFMKPTGEQAFVAQPFRVEAFPPAERNLI
jgi:hypothetical protein